LLSALSNSHFISFQGQCMAQRILLIEDEPAIADTIVYALKTEGFEPVWATTGAEGRQRLADGGIALIVLDVGLPDISGMELCKEIRKSSTIPVIFLTARTGEIDRIVGLEIGGDDYMVKPFSPRELTARVRAVLRRSLSSEKSTACAVAGPVPAGNETPPLSIDTSRMSIICFGKPLDLTRCEFKLLAALMSHPGRVYSRESLKEIAWEEPEFSLERTVDTHIKTIRNKLRAAKQGFDPIETRRGFGYALKET
jgi:two-component system catabolic regulation response regulator CreB